MSANQRVNDVGQPIKPEECPACLDIADSTASGWHGALGDEIQCELPRGHSGDHKYVVWWSDVERSYGWKERVAP